MEKAILKAQDQIIEDIFEVSKEAWDEMGAVGYLYAVRKDGGDRRCMGARPIPGDQPYLLMSLQPFFQSLPVPAIKECDKMVVAIIPCHLPSS